MRYGITDDRIISEVPEKTNFFIDSIWNPLYGFVGRFVPTWLIIPVIIVGVLIAIALLVWLVSRIWVWSYCFNKAREMRWKYTTFLEDHKEIIDKIAGVPVRKFLLKKLWIFAIPVVILLILVIIGAASKSSAGRFLNNTFVLISLVSIGAMLGNFINAYAMLPGAELTIYLWASSYYHLEPYESKAYLLFVLASTVPAILSLLLLLAKKSSKLFLTFKLAFRIRTSFTLITLKVRKDESQIFHEVYEYLDL